MHFRVTQAEEELQVLLLDLRLINDDLPCAGHVVFPFRDARWFGPSYSMPRHFRRDLHDHAIIIGQQESASCEGYWMGCASDS
jgi:hypothetical protein